MTQRPHSAVHRLSVVLFVEYPKAAAALNALLTAHDIAVTTACSNEEFREAAGIEGHVAVVTHTTRIATVCAVTRLPVINIEKFIHTVIDVAPNEDEQRSFDSEAFIDNVILASDWSVPQAFRPGTVSWRHAATDHAAHSVLSK